MLILLSMKKECIHGEHFSETLAENFPQRYGMSTTHMIFRINW